MRKPRVKTPWRRLAGSRLPQPPGRVNKVVTECGGIWVKSAASAQSAGVSSQGTLCRGVGVSSKVVVVLVMYPESAAGPQDRTPGKQNPTSSPCSHQSAPRAAPAPAAGEVHQQQAGEGRVAELQDGPHHRLKHMQVLLHLPAVLYEAVVPRPADTQNPAKHRAH